MSTETSLAICSLHQTEEVRFYCEQCETLICDDCVVGNHSKCTKIKISEYGKKIKHSLDEIVKRSSDTGVPSIKHILEHAKRTKASFNESVDKEIESVKSNTEKIRNMFLILQEELIKSFEDARHVAVQRFDLFIEQNNQRQEKMETILNDIGEKNQHLTPNEIAVYESKLNEILKYDISLDAVPKIEHPKHHFEEESFRNENVRHMIGILDYGIYDLPSLSESKSQTDNRPVTIPNENDSNSENLGIQKMEESNKQTQLTSTPYSETSSDFYGRGQNTRNPEICENVHKYETVTSFKSNSNVAHIVPKKNCKQAWVIGDSVGVLDLSTDRPKYEILMSSMEGQVLAASKSKPNELLVLFNGQTPIKKLQSTTKRFGRGRNYKLKSHIDFQTDQLYTMCTAASSEMDIIACLTAIPSTGNEDDNKGNMIRLSWYDAVKRKAREIVLSPFEIEIANPTALSESPNGDICIICSPVNSSSWMVLLDRDGKQKMRYPPKRPNDRESRSSVELYSFLGAGFLTDGNITILDKVQNRQHLISSSGEKLQINTYDDPPSCLAVDQFGYVWVGFENGNVQLMKYIYRYETVNNG